MFGRTFFTKLVESCFISRRGWMVLSQRSNGCYWSTETVLQIALRREFFRPIGGLQRFVESSNIPRNQPTCQARLLSPCAEFVQQYHVSGKYETLMYNDSTGDLQTLFPNFIGFCLRNQMRTGGRLERLADSLSFQVKSLYRTDKPVTRVCKSRRCPLRNS